MAGESGPCSAWVRRSAATRFGRRRRDHEPFGRPGRQINCGSAGNLKLRRRDPGVPRPDHEISRADAERGEPEGQGSDCLGPARHDDGVDAKDPCGPEEDSVHRPIRPGG